MSNAYTIQLEQDNIRLRQRLAELESAALQSSTAKGEAAKLNLPWSVESVRNEDAEYGEGEESQKGFDAFQIVDAKGRVLFDSLNRDPVASSIEEDVGEDRVYAWDADAKRDANAIVKAVNALAATPSPGSEGGPSDTELLKGRGLPEDVRSFIEGVTLHLQKAGEQSRSFFHEAYALYDKYDVEGWHAKNRAALQQSKGDKG